MSGLDADSISRALSGNRRVTPFVPLRDRFRWPPASPKYDGVKRTGLLHAWHMTSFDGYLYVLSEFGEGLAVFKGKK